jgi:hypothetical protein
MEGRASGRTLMRIMKDGHFGNELLPKTALKEIFETI